MIRRTSNAEPRATSASAPEIQAKAAADDARTPAANDKKPSGGWAAKTRAAVRPPPQTVAKAPADLQPKLPRVSAEVLAGNTAPSGQEPVSQYLRSVKAQLAAEGLPTSAPHARVVLMNETIVGNLTDHGERLARTIAGPEALARGAQIFYPQDGGGRVRSPSEMAAITEAVNVTGRFIKQDAGISELAKAYVKGLPSNIRDYQSSFKAAAADLPAGTDGRARLFLNMSNGYAISEAAGRFVRAAMSQPLDPSKALYKDLEQRLGPPPIQRPPYWPSLQVADLLRDDMREAVKGSQAEITAARNELATTVQQLRKQGVLIFAAAGNEGQALYDHPSDGLNFNNVPGMIVVGATDIGNPADPRDDKMAGFSTSIPGVLTLSTVGVGLPVGPNAEPTLGTSVAAPMAVSIGALMTEANPKLTPDAIEKILTSRGVIHDVPGGIAGAGQVDVVAAVRRAKAWRGH